MTSNKALINEFELVSPPTTLDRGSLLPLIGGRYQVDEGFKAVITVGGTYKETLGPSHYDLHKYRAFRDIKSYLVDMRQKTLEMTTKREVKTAGKPVPIDLELNMTIYYQIENARMIALEVHEPLTKLFEIALDAASATLVHWDINMVRMNRAGLGEAVLKKLKADNLPKILGISVSKVIVTKLAAMDMGDDVLAQQVMDQYTTMQNWQVDSYIAANSNPNEAWLLQNGHENLLIAREEAKVKLLTELIDKGWGDNAAFLNQAAGSDFSDPTEILKQFVDDGNNNREQVYDNTKKLNTGTSQNALLRIKEDKVHLQKKSGLGEISILAQNDDSGIPTGGYFVTVDVPRFEAGHLFITFLCDLNYPNSAPKVSVELNNNALDFSSEIISHWRQEYLIEILHEVFSFLGQ